VTESRDAATCHHLNAQRADRTHACSPTQVVRISITESLAKQLASTGQRFSAAWLQVCRHAARRAWPQGLCAEHDHRRRAGRRRPPRRRRLARRLRGELPGRAGFIFSAWCIRRRWRCGRRGGAGGADAGARARRAQRRHQAARRRHHKARHVRLRSGALPGGPGGARAVPGVMWLQGSSVATSVSAARAERDAGAVRRAAR
jgi:hypothetical protein